MVKKQKQITFGEFTDYLRRLTSTDEYFLANLDKISNWDLWETDMIGSINKFIIRRPIELAFTETTTDGISIDKLKDFCKPLLVNGHAIINRVNEIQNLEHIPPNTIKSVKLHENKVRELVLEGSFSERDLVNEFGITGSRLETLKKRDVTFLVEYRLVDSNQLEGKVNKRVFQKKAPSGEAKEIKSAQKEFDRMPFVAINHRSLYSDVKASLVALDSAYQILHRENELHSRRKLWLKGVANPTKEIHEYNEQINTLPSDAEVSYPSSQPENLEPLQFYIKQLQRDIYHTTSVIPVKQLSGLSGESKKISISGLLDLARSVQREIVTFVEDTLDGMGINAEVNFPPVFNVEPIEEKRQEVEFYNELEDSGVISREEKIKILRDKYIGDVKVE